MRRASLLGLGDHARLLLGAIRLPYTIPDLQLQELLLAQARPKHVAGVAHQSQQKANFFVDRFRRRLLSEPQILIILHRLVADIHEHLVTEQPLDVAHGVLGEYGGLGVPQLVTRKIVIPDLANRAYALLANILEAVIAFLQFATTFLLGGAGDGL